MLERLLEQRWPVTAVLSDPSYTGKNERSLDLTTAQWNMAEDISNVLKPMVTLTELLSEEENASLSVTITMLANFKRRHLAIAEDDSPTSKSLKAKLVEEIDHRWQINDRLFESSLYIQAAVVDPRFKLLPFLDDGKRDEAYICISQLSDHLNAAQRPEQGQAAGERNTTSSDEEGEPVPKKGKTDKQRDIEMLLCGEDEEKEDQGADSKDEMNDYLQDHSKVDSGLLAWWGKNEDST
ncbi:hypothetical protein AAFF_G00372070 [Aldrovandia affinis]|uniref:Uncharacterized protein n=1 Tax=Aldrovandia affinis TaxID=143900 RepID=A0AAD7R4U7_9TELE|nr:hypothetical protein AAFF_G00372070 [Aldrovandia affinis]